MAREAERLLADADWLPEPLRTPMIEDAFGPAAVDRDESVEGDAEALPAFLGGDDDEVMAEDDLSDAYAIAAQYPTSPSAAPPDAPPPLPTPTPRSQPTTPVIAN